MNLDSGILAPVRKISRSGASLGMIVEFRASNPHRIELRSASSWLPQRSTHCSSSFALVDVLRPDLAPLANEKDSSSNSVSLDEYCNPVLRVT